MSVQERDRGVLDRGMPGFVKEEQDYVIDNEQFQSIGEVPIEEREPQSSPQAQKLEETKAILSTAIDALSGSMKVIEQLYGNNTTVGIKPHEKEVKKSVKRVFGRDSNVITFTMYQQALAELRIQADSMMEKAIDVQGQTD